MLREHSGVATGDQQKARKCGEQENADDGAQKAEHRDREAKAAHTRGVRTGNLPSLATNHPERICPRSAEIRAQDAPQQETFTFYSRNRYVYSLRILHKPQP